MFRAKKKHKRGAAGEIVHLWRVLVSACRACLAVQTRVNFGVPSARCDFSLLASPLKPSPPFDIRRSVKPSHTTLLLITPPPFCHLRHLIVFRFSSLDAPQSLPRRASSSHKTHIHSFRSHQQLAHPVINHLRLQPPHTTQIEHCLSSRIRLRHLHCHSWRRSPLHRAISSRTLSRRIASSGAAHHVPSLSFWLVQLDKSHNH